MNTLIHEQVYRGQALLDKMAKQKIILCGAGAVGSNIAENLIRQGFKVMEVIDMDRVDDHNRHTQMFDRRDIGQMKVNALKGRIFNVMGISIGVSSSKLEEGNVKKLLSKDAIVIDGFDNTESRRLVTEYCRKENIQCLHVGLNTDYAEVIWNQSYRVPGAVKGMDVCEYPLARNVILMAVAVASEVLVKYLSDGAMRNYIVTLGDMKVQEIIG